MSQGTVLESSLQWKCLQLLLNLPPLSYTVKLIQLVVILHGHPVYADHSPSGGAPKRRAWPSSRWGSHAMGHGAHRALKFPFIQGRAGLCWPHHVGRVHYE